MSTPYQFEDVVVPRGSFLSWGNHVGQHATGKVLDYLSGGGTDFAGEPCPQITLELIEPAASFSKDGERTDFPAGELVVLNCGQASLKRAVRAADPTPGDVIKITLQEFAKTSNGTAKIFAIQIARGAAPEVRRQSAPQQGFGQAPAQQSFGQAPAAAPAANPFSGAPAAAPAANTFAQPQQPANPPF